MKLLLKTEEAFLFILSIYIFAQLEYAWWWFPALLLLPDIGMLGYLINTKIGAVIYNLVHHRAASIIVYIIGSIIISPIIQLIGIIMFAHTAMDRVFDYGLKYSDNFKHTHLSE